MKLNKKYILDAVISKDQTRTAITNALLCKNGNETLAIATNGRAMAIVPVELEEGEAGLISSEALKAGRKIGGKREENIVATINGNIAFNDGSAVARPSEQDNGNFPNWKQILPSETQKIVFTVALNPILLSDLANSIGSPKSVILRFSAAEDVIRVTGRDGDGEVTVARGLLMPIRL